MSLGESEGFIDISNLNNPTNLDEPTIMSIQWIMEQMIYSQYAGHPEQLEAQRCQEVITCGEQWLWLLII